MPTVVIDAGHGGYDAGAVNGTRYEKDDNLRVALAVGKKLEECGINVVYTRKTDVFIPLLERSKISNNANADLFVSIHRNSFTNPESNGVENFIYTNPSAKSIIAAQNVLDEVVKGGVQNNRGVQRQNFSVLRETAAPAMLLELGFISNEEDNRLFDLNFDKYVDGIVKGIGESVGVSCPITTIPPVTDGIETIKRIQSTLNQRYNSGLAVDGIWGPASQKELTRALQIELNNIYGAGLATDGIWGPKTQAAIRNVREGDRGNLVYILQASLFTQGFQTTPDGIFGPNTKNAVINLQNASGLIGDGIAGRNTFTALFG